MDNSILEPNAFHYKVPFEIGDIVLFIKATAGSVSESATAFVEGQSPHKTVAVWGHSEATVTAHLAALVYRDFLKECVTHGVPPRQMHFCWRREPYTELVENGGGDAFLEPYVEAPPEPKLWRARTRYSMWPVKDD